MKGQLAGAGAATKGRQHAHSSAEPATTSTVGAPVPARALTRVFHPACMSAATRTAAITAALIA